MFLNDEKLQLMIINYAKRRNTVKFGKNSINQQQPISKLSCLSNIISSTKLPMAFRISLYWKVKWKPLKKWFRPLQCFMQNDFHNKSTYTSQIRHANSTCYILTAVQTLLSAAAKHRLLRLGYEFFVPPVISKISADASGLRMRRGSWRGKVFFLADSEQKIQVNITKMRL